MSKIDSFLEKLGVKEPGDAIDDMPEPVSEAPVGPKVKPAEPVGGAFHRNPDKVVGMNRGTSIREGGARSSSSTNASMKVVLINPKNIDDCQQIADCLKDKRPVVINLENVDEPTAVRIIDFISGTIYALDGRVNKISRNVWLFAPKNVSVAVNQQGHGNFADMPWNNE